MKPNMRALQLENKKQATLLYWTILRSQHPLHQPTKVRIPLQLANGEVSTPCVEINERVIAGQPIAQPQNEKGVAIHASLSGWVREIGEIPHTMLGHCLGITIESDRKDETMPQMGKERADWSQLSVEAMLELLQSLGLINLDEGEEALHQKIKRARQQKIETLILNGFESEPYITSFHTLMMSHPLEVLKGAEIVRRLVEAERIVIMMEDHKLEVAELLKSKIYFLKWNHVDVEVVPAQYPQDLEPLIMKSFHERCGSKNELELNDDLFVLNIPTAFSVYEAVILQKPLIERAVTVGGECVVEPRNLWVRIGTTFQETFKVCRGLLREPKKLLAGGPMRGYAQPDLNGTLNASTHALLALPPEVVADSDPLPCIRCGECIEVCPSDISPAMITLAAEKDLFDLSREYGLDGCIHCGNCSYVCPSKRPLLELIRYAESKTQRPSLLKRNFLLELVKNP